jgi:hypothetical protein
MKLHPKHVLPMHVRDRYRRYYRQLVDIFTLPFWIVALISLAIYDRISSRR